jgi:Leucine-rich repeat (LRR) protein
MGQILSVQETYITPLTLAFSQKLIMNTTSSTNKHSELTLAKACKAGYFRQYYPGKTVVVLYDPHHKLSEYAENIKALQLLHGWEHLKFDSTWDSQSSKCAIKALCLEGAIGAPEKLDLGCVTSLMIGPSSVTEFMSTISIIVKFTNLESLSLSNVTLCSNGISMLSKLSLKFLYLEHCDINCHLQEIFENCTTLQEIYILSCNHLDFVSIKLHSQLRRFKIEDDGLRRVDASKCTQLESL